MKTILKYLKPYWRYVILGPLFMVLEVSMDLLQPKLMSKIIDIGVVNLDIDYVIHYGLIMIGIGLIGLVGGISSSIFGENASTRFSADLREDLYEKIQYLSFKNIDKLQSSSLITRLTVDINTIQELVSLTLRMMVRAPMLVIGSGVMLFLINVKLALVILLLIPILILLFSIIIKKGSPFFIIIQKKLDGLNRVIEENFSNIRVVKTFVRSDYEKAKFKKANDEYYETMMKTANIIAAAFPVIMLVFNIGTVIVLWFGNNLFDLGDIKIGELMASLNYMTQMLMSFIMLSGIVIFLARSKASIQRIDEVFETELDIKNKQNSIILEKQLKGNIEFKNVGFYYDENHKVLKGVNFNINSGEMVAILGTTGAGKTTIVSLISRLYDVTEGSVLIDGYNIKDFNKKYLRENISFCLQEAKLFAGKISDNLRYGNKKASYQEIVKAARVAQAHEFISKLENGYESLLNQKGVNFSGGQKQRLAIARALLKRAPILIMDDSTSAVDMKTEKQIQEELRKNYSDRTIIIIAQRISSVKKVDKIILLDNGEIVGIGNHNYLLKNNPIYQDIYKSQTGKEGVNE